MASEMSGKADELPVAALPAAKPTPPIARWASRSGANVGRRGTRSPRGHIGNYAVGSLLRSDMAEKTKADWQLDLKPVHLRSGAASRLSTEPVESDAAEDFVDRVSAREVHEALSALSTAIEGIAQRIAAIERVLSIEPVTTQRPARIKPPPRALRPRRPRSEADAPIERLRDSRPAGTSILSAEKITGTDEQAAP